MKRRFAGLETLAIHAGQPPDPLTGALVPPISLSTTFAQEAPGKHRGFEYSRSDNPTRRALEQCVAALEACQHATAFASGCAATTTLLQTLRPGAHVVASDDVYGGTFRLLDQVFAPMGVACSWVDMTDLNALRAAFRAETQLLWVETPSNPLVKVIDIPQVAELAHAHSALLCVDNTFATPVLQRPLELGADVVLHSATKYLGGHGDVVGGLLACRDPELNERLRFLQNAIGAVPSPFDCYLLLRGLKTLSVRVGRQSESAERLANWLAVRPEVERVHYPGLNTHPQHALAQRQMNAFGGMLSFVLGGGHEAALTLLSRLELFACAESLGSVESLIELPASMTHASVPPATRQQLGIVDGLVRISVGLEAQADLRDDLKAALEAVK